MREEFREALIEMQHNFRQDHQFLNAVRVRRILRKRQLFDQLYEQTVKQAAKDLADSPRAKEFGDGEFGKWLIEWFSNGGWETVIAFIRALIPLFAGL